MNKFQRVVVIVAAVNIVLMLLFPPCLDTPLRRGMLPSFEGFYPFYQSYGIKRIHNELLTLQLLFVVINALIAWLALDRRQAEGALPRFRHTRAIVLFMAVNLALLLTFPPFESYASLMKFEPAYFDGFYFVFGDKHQRNFFVPLLYLEILLVIVNGLTLWLLFNTIMRDEREAKGRILELAQSLPPQQRAEIARTLGDADGAGGQTHAGGQPQLGTGPDRRKFKDPDYRGPERRKGGDRRRKPRA
ncbi:MAG TPA: hypothetical protein PKC23_10405 [Candidatus Desulfobacillus sp.]|nr:hypothetical protein [Candidatus Desulfobacillus sp.]